jgi:hypothetical protein
MWRAISCATPLSIVLIATLTGCPKQPERFTNYRYPDCPKALALSDATTIKAVVATDAGMHGLWDPAAFAAICDFNAWEKTFVKNETIEPYIRRGSFVPIYIHEDGGPLFEVRVGSDASPAAPSAQEENWATATSAPYLFVSQGALALSGIEQIHGGGDIDVKPIALPAGRWMVTTHILEPPREASGKNDRVPNFLVLVNPEPKEAPTYRTSVETFSKK